MSGVHSEAVRPMLLSSMLKERSLVRTASRHLAASEHAQKWSLANATTEGS